MLVGVHERYQGDGSTTVEETLERYPLTSIIREFHPNPIEPQNLIPKLEKLCRTAWDAGLIVAVSFKFSVDAVLNGKWRPFIQQAASYIKEQRVTDKTIVVIWHEPENDFDHADQFVGYFNIVHGWLTKTNPQLATCHAALGYRYASHISDAEAKLWGKTRATIKAIDIYSGNSFPLTSILPELVPFKRWLTYTVGTGPYAVMERGWVATTTAQRDTRAASIAREAQWLRDSPEGQRCTAYVTWLTSGSEGNAGLLPDALMMQAVDELMAVVNKPDETEQPPEPPPTKTTDCPLCLGAGHVAAGQTITIVRVAT